MGDDSFDSDGSSGRWKGTASSATHDPTKSERVWMRKNARQGGKPYDQDWPVRRVVAQAGILPQFRKRLAWGFVVFELAHNRRLTLSKSRSSSKSRR